MATDLRAKELEIGFRVEGKPPKKFDDKSGWSRKRAVDIRRLREKALEARKQAGLKDCFHCPVKIEIAIYSPNVIDRSSHDHVGDLDSFIAGICEYLQPAHQHALPYLSEIFEGIDEDAHPSKALLIEDDCKVVSIEARKTYAENTYYTVKVTPAKL